MTRALTHRGPDHEGALVIPERHLGLGHRRLSIIDITAAGHQPMYSPSLNYVVVFNGEIYNHSQLRSELDRLNIAPVWRGSSDTETVCACIDAWGIAETLVRCIGMFSIAIFCRNTCTLTLARDRFGEKPLYYSWQNRRGAHVFVFGSELSALRAHPNFSPEVDRGALVQYMQHGYIPGGQSIYNAVNKLPPGCMLTVSRQPYTESLQQYWNSVEIAHSASLSLDTSSEDRVISNLEGLLQSAVEQQMNSDVPYGAFLSGGIDSSLITALMQTHSRQPINTFTLGFHEHAFNEANEAAAIAKHLGTRHHELYLSTSDVIDTVPRMGQIYDEPFADASQIPTYLISKFARNHVTVALTGDGADELFGGYNRHLLADSLAWYYSRVRPYIPGRLITYIFKLAERNEDSVLKVLRNIPFFKRIVSSLTTGRKRVHQYEYLFMQRTLPEFYMSLLCAWDRNVEVVLESKPYKHLSAVSAINLISDLSNAEKVMLFDLIGYLPDDVLTKVDRATMSVGLESRAPFLDHRIAEYSWRLPPSFKIRGRRSKWILRQLLYRHIPQRLVERPKKGFGAPISDWLRGPLKEWSEHLLNVRRLESEGYLNPKVVQTKWDEHLSGRADWSTQLWNVLMFQAWLEYQNA